MSEHSLSTNVWLPLEAGSGSITAQTDQSEIKNKENLMTANKTNIISYEYKVINIFQNDEDFRA